MTWTRVLCFATASVVVFPVIGTAQSGVGLQQLLEQGYEIRGAIALRGNIQHNLYLQLGGSAYACTIWPDREDASSSCFSLSSRSETDSETDAAAETAQASSADTSQGESSGQVESGNSLRSQIEGAFRAADCAIEFVRDDENWSGEMIVRGAFSQLLEQGHSVENILVELEDLDRQYGLDSGSLKSGSGLLVIEDFEGCSPNPIEPYRSELE